MSSVNLGYIVPTLFPCYNLRLRFIPTSGHGGLDVLVYDRYKSINKVAIVLEKNFVKMESSATEISYPKAS